MIDKRAEKALRREMEKRSRTESQATSAEQALIGDMEARFWAAPFGQARSAKLAGDRYFQIEIPLDSTARTVGFISTTKTRTHKYTGHGRTITDIEREGWELIEAGFVFKETGQTSRDKFISSGQTVNTTGDTWGVYLFRATEQPPRDDAVWLEWASARTQQSSQPKVP